MDDVKLEIAVATIPGTGRPTCCNGFGHGNIVWTKPSEQWYNLRGLSEDKACWLWTDALGIADGVKALVDVPVTHCPYCGSGLPEDGPVEKVS